MSSFVFGNSIFLRSNQFHSFNQYKKKRKWFLNRIFFQICANLTMTFSMIPLFFGYFVCFNSIFGWKKKNHKLTHWYNALYSISRIASFLTNRKNQCDIVCEPALTVFVYAVYTQFRNGGLLYNFNDIYFLFLLVVVVIVLRFASYLPKYNNRQERLKHSTFACRMIFRKWCHNCTIVRLVNL